MKPYILGIATASSDSTISNSFKNYIPDKNPKNSSQNSDGKWLTIPLSSRSQAQSIINNYNDCSFALPIKSYCGNSNGNGDGLDANYRVTYKPTISSQLRSLQYSTEGQDAAYGVVPYMHDTAINKMPPSITNNIFGSVAILWSVIALASVILLIGILVSVLYRIPGIFAFGTILCSLSLTLFIMLTTGYVLSLGLLAGLFVGLIVGTMSVFAIMERIKKRHQTGIGFDNAFKVGTKKGILPTIDLHAILLLCGVCFIYFNRLQLEIFGVSIVFISLFSFIFNVFL
jgi:SecD/SecF fusion protein